MQLLSVNATKLPPWRGFNLLNKFILEYKNDRFSEEDFDIIAQFGFNFVRFPMDYRCWTKAPGEHNEGVLNEIDEAIEFGRARGIHVNLNLHRAPGYTVVSQPKEPFDLWADDAGGEEARRQFASQWRMFAERYKGIPNDHLSFDLVNEPANVEAAPYARAVEAAVAAIRGVDPDRLIIADGLQYGTIPVPEIAHLGIAQSTRGYEPHRFTHWQAGWVPGSSDYPQPHWPYEMPDGKIYDREMLRERAIAPWKALEAQGVGVHVGEWGAYNKTAHADVLAWMRDQLSLWREAGWGWALWNLSGDFGIFDSNRADVAYENFRGRKLDRKMLELLREDLAP
jgi:endoglucanase